MEKDFEKSTDLLGRKKWEETEGDGQVSQRLDKHRERSEVEHCCLRSKLFRGRLDRFLSPQYRCLFPPSIIFTSTHRQARGERQSEKVIE